MIGDNVTERNFVDKNGNSWTWEETPETIEALKQLHATVQLHNDMRKEHERTKLATPLKERPKAPPETPST